MTRIKKLSKIEPLGGRHRPRTHSPAAAVTFHVGPVYGSGQGGGSSGSRPPSLPGSTPGSRSHSAVRGEKARSPPPLTAVAASPSSYVKRRERLTSPSGIGGGRPRFRIFPAPFSFVVCFHHNQGVIIRTFSLCQNFVSCVRTCQKSELACVSCLF